VTIAWAGVQTHAARRSILPLGVVHSTHRRALSATLGGGMETMFRDHWLLRAEYRCADFGTWSPTDAYSSPGIASMLSITNAIRVRPQTATPGLGYKF
jgi:opacity protein-like surface antigen